MTRKELEKLEKKMIEDCANKADELIHEMNKIYWRMINEQS